jgi:hypothetical protein
VIEKADRLQKQRKLLQFVVEEEVHGLAAQLD